MLPTGRGGAFARSGAATHHRLRRQGSRGAQQRQRGRTVVPAGQGKLESLLRSLTLRYGSREDRRTRAACGACGTRTSSTPASTSAPRSSGTASLAGAIRNGTPAEVSLEERLRSVANGIAAHQGIASGRAVALADVLPAGW
jgi:myo-inositol 2-dehydrogenase / D-chiro-inositol 1-dehydrogenase